MGLAYILLIVMIVGALAAAFALFVLAREILKKSRLKFLAVIPLMIAAFLSVVAFYFLSIFLREPPWIFHF